jgi:hemolysin activation/secretion protein
MDNIGARSTGRNRLTTNLNLNSPLDLADLFSGNFVHTGGSDYLRLAYSIPVGSDGWRVGANLSTLSYKLVAAEFAAMNAKGASTSMGLEANYPIIRSRLKNLYVGLNYDRKRFNNEANQVISSSYQINNYSVGLNGNLFDNLAGGGANNFNLALVGGGVNLGSIDSQENAALDGGFNKLRYNATRQQVITERISLFVALSGQESGNKNLDSSEKFYLGGAGGVRAYPASEGGGSSGKLINLELRQRLPQGFNLSGFYDYGDIRNYDGSKSYSLKGAGASLAWQAEFGLNLKATLAQRLGNNPNPTATGNDQDGSLVKSRWWLTASMPF